MSFFDLLISSHRLKDISIYPINEGSYEDRPYIEDFIKFVKEIIQRKNLVLR